MSTLGAFHRRVLTLALLLAFIAQCVAFARANSQTYDEGVTLASGLLLLRGGPETNGEHPPLARLIAALPLAAFGAPPVPLEAWQARRESAFSLGRMFLYETGADHERLLWPARAAMILLATLLLLVSQRLAARLFGEGAGLVALALLAFDPNLIAHGSLVGHDGPLALFTALTALGLVALFAAPRLGVLAATGAAVGLCMATKHSGVVVLAAACLALGLEALLRGRTPPLLFDAPPPKTRSAALVAALANVLALAGVALLVVRLTYLPRGFGDYVQSLGAQLAHQRVGHRAFFLGEIGNQGWLSYFPVALFAKAPPLLLLLALASLAFWRWGTSARAAAVVWLVIALFGAALVTSKVAIGIRYGLPIVPLLAVVASRVATFRFPAAGGGRKALAIAALAGVYHVSAALRVAPHDLAYFSDLVGGPTRGARLLADSNLDWGQGLRALSSWMKQTRPRELMLAYFGTASPNAYGVHAHAAPNSCPHPAPLAAAHADEGGRGEYLAVSVMNLQGVFFADRHAYRFLGERKPAAVLGHSIVVYDLTDDGPAHAALAALYERSGLPEGAEREREHARRAGSP